MKLRRGGRQVGRARRLAPRVGRAAPRERSRRSSSHPTASPSSRAARRSAAPTSTVCSPGSGRPRAALPQEYAAALAQRNAALRRVQLGLAPREAVAPWTERVASLGARLVEARRRAVSRARAGLTAPSSPSSACRRRRSPTTVSPRAPPALDGTARRSTSPAARPGSARTSTSSRSAPPGATCASFGSQGEQRLALLALLLAEAQLLPLDAAAPPRRRPLRARRSAPGGARRARSTALDQTVITTTHRSALPARAEPGRGGEPWNRSLKPFAGSLPGSAATPTSPTSPSAGRPRSATRSRGTRGRRASPATERCT